MTDTFHGIPRIGDTAPDFTAVTTQGELNFHDWAADSWVLLFSHPADFTPVCSTELVELAKHVDTFDALNTKLIGVSIDSVHSHLAWIENLKQITGVRLPYPLIADSDRSVAELYGMLHPNESATVTVRALFFIDPQRSIRAMIYYPLNTGRSVPEIIRELVALQTADANGVACPVNWQTGEKVIVPPPKTLADVDDRNTEGKYDRQDFYLCRRDL